MELRAEQFMQIFLTSNRLVASGKGIAGELLPKSYFTVCLAPRMDTDTLMASFLRRGVLWPTAEIYGGLQGFYDYGDAGSSVKRNLETAWERWFVGLSPGYYRIDPALVLPESVLRASGHLDNFSDPLVACDVCGERFRADSLLEEWGIKDVEGLKVEEIQAQFSQSERKCPKCGKGRLTPPKAFNLMFGLDIGPEGRERGYLRPETAQSSYLAFSRLWNVMRKKLPLGVAVVGRVYRNEIAPRQVLFRLREFTQAELQIFFDPEAPSPSWQVPPDARVPALTARNRAQGANRAEPVALRQLVESGEMPGFYAYHLFMAYRFYRDVLGYPEGQIRLFEKNDRERAFYNRIQYDIELNLESLGGFKEMGAVHYRGDYDLSRHSEDSKSDLGVTLDGGKHLIPHVLELTFGVDRNVWGLGDVHLHNEKDRIVWSLPPYLAPAVAGVLPLIPKEHGPMATMLYHTLRTEGFRVTMDESGSIGRRYARLDEIGVPFAITVDRESLSAQTYTIRNRDGKDQVRGSISDILSILRKAVVSPLSIGNPL